MTANQIVTKKVLSPVGLNIRSTPNTTIDPIASLPYGASVDVLEGTVANGSGYTWTEVLVPGQPRWGWCAVSIGGKPTMGVDMPPVPVQRGNMAGLHKIQGGVGNETIIGIAAQLKAAGKPLASVTVVNEPDLANKLAPLVKYVIYRHQEGGSNDNPPPGTNGYTWIADRWENYQSLDPRVFIQPTNEPVWDSSDNQFWLGVMQALELKGRRGAILTYGVGNPDDKGMNEIDKWKSLTPALTHAKTNGHIVALHAYSKRGTPPGQLSDDTANYELRYRRFYAPMPDSARPVLVLSEIGNEYDKGAYYGTVPTSQFLGAYHAEMRKDSYLAAWNLWTAGNTEPWGGSSVDGYLDTFERDISAGRYL